MNSRNDTSHVIECRQQYTPRTNLDHVNEERSTHANWRGRVKRAEMHEAARMTRRALTAHSRCRYQGDSSAATTLHAPNAKMHCHGRFITESFVSIQQQLLCGFMCSESAFKSALLITHGGSIKQQRVWLNIIVPR